MITMTTCVCGECSTDFPLEGSNCLMLKTKKRFGVGICKESYTYSAFCVLSAQSQRTYAILYISSPYAWTPPFHMYGLCKRIDVCRQELLCTCVCVRVRACVCVSKGGWFVFTSRGESSMRCHKTCLKGNKEQLYEGGDNFSWSQGDCALVASA